MYEWTNSKMAIIWYCGNGIGLAGVQECQSSVVALSTKRESSEGVRPDPTHSHTLFQTTQFSCSFNSMEREIPITKKKEENVFLQPNYSFLPCCAQVKAIQFVFPGKSYRQHFSVVRFSSFEQRWKNKHNQPTQRNKNEERTYNNIKRISSLTLDTGKTNAIEVGSAKVDSKDWFPPSQPFGLLLTPSKWKTIGKEKVRIVVLCDEHEVFRFRLFRLTGERADCGFTLSDLFL